jgi:penicillin amidase
VIRRVLAVLGIIIVAVSGGSALFVLSSLPQVDGAVTVRGLRGPVTISRDRDGVPLITADSDEDAAFALGYVHAQDRLFQMELQRRYGAGRLAEIFGAPAVATDRLMRTLGLYRAAEAELPLLSPAVRNGLEAYAAGVNAFLATRRGSLPPEFLLLRFRPEPWRPSDTLAWGKLMGLQLGGNYRGELVRAGLAKTLSQADLALLYPEYPSAGPSILSELVPIYRALPLDRLHAALPDLVGPIYASNNWVVDGEHSASRMPLLANDPHLGFGAPGFWYLARLKTPEREVAGGTVAGTPFVVVGHNERIAWGFTTATADIEDLFIEKLDPTNPARYVIPGGTAGFVTREETIAVRGGIPVTITVRTTRHGPVISDVISDALPGGYDESGYVLALAATFLDDDDRSAEALWRIDRAADWAAFTDALKNFVGPPQNIVYADRDGTVAYILPGRIPIRRHGNGWMPVPGWSGEYDWKGYIPFAQLPQAANPASGHFVTANNRIAPDTYPYFISRDWDLPNRAARIEALLAATPVQSPETSAAIEADTLSIMARQLVPLMTRIALPTGPAREAIDRLRKWDFHMDADKVEPLLFTAWLRNFSHSLFTARLGKAAAEYWDLRPAVIEKVLGERRDWCNDADMSCDARLAGSLDAAIAELRRDYGPDMAQWQWRRAHIAEFVNPVFDRVAWLRDWIRVAIPTPGSYDTVNRGPSTIRDDAHPYRQRFGAGLRIITDMAAPSQSRMMVVPGQSGNPLSPHFADLLARWRNFAWLVPGKAMATSTLTLVPAR